MDRETAREILTLGPDQHGLILGMTGTGKSTLARVMLSLTPYNQLVLIDPKGDFSIPSGLTISQKKGPGRILLCSLPAEAVRGIERGHNVLWRPHPEHQSRDDVNDVLKSCYWSEHAPVRVYIDEVALLMTASVYPAYYAAILQSGRSRQVGMLATTQRPSGIPSTTKTESTKSWVFRLRMLRDRQTAAEWMEYNSYSLDPRDPHGFWYRAEQDDKARYCVIEFVE